MTGRLASRATCLLVLVLVLLAANPHPATARENTPPAPDVTRLFGGPFDLTDHTGARRTDQDFDGKWRLMFFGYTNCPDICPTNLAIMTEALESLPADMAAAIAPIFITLDPARDTSDYLADYVAALHPKLIGLTGDAKALTTVMRSFRIHRRKVPDASLPEGNYWIDHSSLTFLMGPDGRFVTLFPHDTDAGVMSERIASHLRNQGHPPPD